MGNHSLSESSMPGLPHGALNHFSPQVGERLWARGPGTCGRFRLFAGDVLWGAAYFWWPDLGELVKWLASRCSCSSLVIIAIWCYMFIDVWYMTGTIILDMSGDLTKKNSYQLPRVNNNLRSSWGLFLAATCLFNSLQVPVSRMEHIKQKNVRTFHLPRKETGLESCAHEPSRSRGGCRGVSAQDCWKVLQKLCR